ncbi:MAG TPA: aminotransferase class I/II-fold pyridoxal phosphate-dependent enzyme [Acidobacteriaceae bacterium]
MPPDTNLDELLARLHDAQSTLDAGFVRLPPNPAPALDENAAAILAEAATLLHNNDPYFHPLYAGQMLKPPHPIARAAYALAMSINPNNHALDGGRASSAMELESVAALAKMFGWPQHLGHLTSGGTVANLEALWIAGALERENHRQPARQLHPARAIAASSQAHYTHSRISAVLGLPFISIPTDDTGRMDLDALERILATQDIGTVVATLGTTAVGAVDPLDRLLTLQKRYPFRIHVDAAYGGYFTLAGNLPTAARLAFDAIPYADSLVVDPHKHGLQPYGCGCILFRDPAVGRFYQHDSPYTYFTSHDLHLGEISLECSRAGAAAVALWATQRLLPCVPGGAFARGLEAGRDAALALHRTLSADPRFVLPIAPPTLDILFWAPRAATPQDSSALSQAIFDEARRRDLYLALATLPVRFFPATTWPAADPLPADASVTVLRSVLMKPEHLDWTGEIARRLDAATTAVLAVNSP